VRVHALKVLEGFLAHASVTRSFRFTALGGGTPFLARRLLPAFGDSAHSVRQSVCACLTHLREEDWRALGEAGRAEAMERLRGAAGDDFPAVRAAVCRAYGTVALMPACNGGGPTEPAAFLRPTAAVLLKATADSNKEVRGRAHWALAQLFSTSVASSGVRVPLVDHSAAPPAAPAAAAAAPAAAAAAAAAAASAAAGAPAAPPGLLPRDTALRMVQVSLAASAESDKVASNAVRLLGFLGCALDPLDAEEGALQARAAEALAARVAADGAAVKVRWNACFAAEQLLRAGPGRLGKGDGESGGGGDSDAGGSDDAVAAAVAARGWALPLWLALVHALDRCDNFKVRTKAAMALRSMFSRSGFASTAAAAAGGGEPMLSVGSPGAGESDGGRNGAFDPFAAGAAAIDGAGGTAAAMAALRISPAATAAAAEQRNPFALALRTSLAALVGLDAVRDVASMGYKVTLERQLWRTLLHLLALVTEEDLAEEAAWLGQHAAFLAAWVQKLVRCVPAPAPACLLLLHALPLRIGRPS